MSGDFHLPYEDGPDGPLEVDMRGAVLAGGIVVRSAVIPVLDGSRWPALVFNFQLADGGQTPPVVLIMEPGRLARLLPAILEPAVASALREATS